MEVKKMNTQEAIEFLDKRNILDKVLKMKMKDVKKLAKLLQQGEIDKKELKIVKEELKKHRQMWEEVKQFHKQKHYIDSLEYYEQKHFPKE